MSTKTIWCLSIYQPWAQLIALGEKRFETRTWMAGWHRGLLGIHVSKRWTHEERYFLTQPFYRDALARHGYGNGELPRGCLLAVVNLRAIFHVEDMRHDLTPQEEAFGNYADGRWAWLMENARLLPEPIPMNGKTGLFKVQIPVEALMESEAGNGGL